MSKGFAESVVEGAAFARLEPSGTPSCIAPTSPRASRRRASRPGYRDVVLERRLRDTVLPKLISGELHVTRTEKLLEKVK
jgi:hypothetical protein